jgi:hypothetical protein
MRNKTSIPVFFVSLLVLFLSCNGSLAETNDKSLKKDISDITIINPDVYDPFEFRSSFSILFSSIPIDWLEISLDVPILQFSTRMGLPSGFTLNGTLQTVFISNEFCLGADWNYVYGPFSFSLGIDEIFLWGLFRMMEFQNNTLGFSTNPNLSIGYKTDEVAYTIYSEFNFLSSLNLSSGNSEINTDRFKSPGGSVSLFLEQRLWSNKVMIVGLINNFYKFFFPAWPAYHVFQKLYYIPQVQIGLIL